MRLQSSGQQLATFLNPFQPIRASLLLLLACPAIAQTTPVVAPAATGKVKAKARASKAEGPGFNPNVVLLDPAHGGTDEGAKMGNHLLEKDVTLALAGRLRIDLAAKGFTVLLTREAGAEPTTADARVELANRARPVACLLLHASAAGHGVHLFTSSLAPPPPADPNNPAPITPWDTAQTPSLAQSVRLSNDLAAALNGSRIPLVVAPASIAPIDSMACPAVMLEFAPLKEGEAQTPVSDAAYQQKLADALAQALVFWRVHALSAAAAKATPQPASGTPAVKPPPKPKPKLIKPPIEVPEETSPAPIIRRAPAGEAPPQ